MNLDIRGWREPASSGRRLLVRGALVALAGFALFLFVAWLYTSHLIAEVLVGLFSALFR